MRVEPIIASVKSQAPAVQARLPANQKTAQRDGNAEKSVQIPSLVELSGFASDMQKNMNIIHNVDLQFSVSKNSDRIMVTVTEKATGKIVREIPSSELIKFAEKFDEMVGMIFDQKG